MTESVRRPPHAVEQRCAISYRSAGPITLHAVNRRAGYRVAAQSSRHRFAVQAALEGSPMRPDTP